MPDNTDKSNLGSSQSDGTSVAPTAEHHETIAEQLSNIPNKVADKIKNAENILVALSTDPSVDEISAAISLTMLLDQIGKHVTAIYSGKTPNTLEFLKPEDTFEKDTNSLQDFIIALNKNKADHLRYKIEGDYVKVYITPYKTTISEKDLEFTRGDYNVDLVITINVKSGDDIDGALIEYGRIMHDATAVNITTDIPGRFAELEWSDPSMSSVCEMVAVLADRIGVKSFNVPTATALLTGIVSATERFSNARTTSATMSISAKLMSAGADQQLIAMHIMEPESEKQEETKPIKQAKEIKKTKKTEELSKEETKPEEVKLETMPEATKEEMKSAEPVPNIPPVIVGSRTPEVKPTVNPDVSPINFVAPKIVEAPVAPVAPIAPVVSAAPVASMAPIAPVAPAAPVTPELTPEQQLEQLVAAPAATNNIMDELRNSTFMLPTNNVNQANQASQAPVMPTTAITQPVPQVQQQMSVAPVAPVTSVAPMAPVAQAAPAFAQSEFKIPTQIEESETTDLPKIVSQGTAIEQNVAAPVEKAPDYGKMIDEALTKAMQNPAASAAPAVPAYPQEDVANVPNMQYVPVEQPMQMQSTQPQYVQQPAPQMQSVQQPQFIQQSTQSMQPQFMQPVQQPMQMMQQPTQLVQPSTQSYQQPMQPQSYQPAQYILPQQQPAGQQNPFPMAPAPQIDYSMPMPPENPAMPTQFPPLR